MVVMNKVRQNTNKGIDNLVKARMSKMAEFQPFGMAGEQTKKQSKAKGSETQASRSGRAYESGDRLDVAQCIFCDMQVLKIDGYGYPAAGELFTK